tara:strand:- start:273 stop:476 length:204 start_codon:yes stop_codon:yes gene_type:complete
MKLIDTPNPNAKKILIDQNKEDIANSLEKLESIFSVFIGPDFITVTKEDNFEWEVITEDIVSIFDKL